jgi:voltage-gated potassium channel
METNKPPKPIRDAAEKETSRYHPVRSLFLLDVLFDRDSRPALLWALGTLLAGTLFYHWAEGWSYLDALYFSVVSLGTVGYGDLTPTTPIARMFTIVYLINGIVILLALFDRMRIVRSQRVRGLATRQRES